MAKIFFLVLIMATVLILAFDTTEAKRKIKCSDASQCSSYCSGLNCVDAKCLGGYCECLRCEGGV
uniref:Venom peptide HtKTx1 n=1 Tax=Hadogenes troglodytes TaxID=1577150 RepID=A0A1B3IJ16_9SCOR|nr:venom peptide HtKTx1 [Hadogenes troglodytes]